MKDKQIRVRYIGGEAFSKFHEQGAKDYGSAWLSANMAIAEHAQGRVDISDPAVKELLSFLALRCLIRLRVDGHLPTAAQPPVAPKEEG